MEKEEGIKKFISGDFGKATIKGKITKEKIILELIMIGKPEEFIEYSGEELKCEFSINNIETFNCLLSNYLNRNMLCLAYYYNEKIRNKETYVFSLAGDRKLDLHFDKEFFSKLPSDLPILINRKVRNDALEFIKDLDIRNVVIQNLDHFNKNMILYDGFPEEYFFYNAFSYEDAEGNHKNSDEEKIFLYKLFEYFINKEEIDIDYLYNVKMIVEEELSNKEKTNIIKNVNLKLNKKYYGDLEINFNSKIVLIVKNIETLILFKEFLDSYLNKYEKDITKKER